MTEEISVLGFCIFLRDARRPSQSKSSISLQFEVLLLMDRRKDFIENDGFSVSLLVVTLELDLNIDLCPLVSIVSSEESGVYFEFESLANYASRSNPSRNTPSLCPSRLGRPAALQLRSIQLSKRGLFWTGASLRSEERQASLNPLR